MATFRSFYKTICLLQVFLFFILFISCIIMGNNPLTVVLRSLAGKPPLIPFIPPPLELKSTPISQQEVIGSVTTTTTTSSGLKRLVFMSCNRQSMVNPFWRVIDEIQPNVLIWMGDIIYADHTGPQWRVILSVLVKLVLHPVATFRAAVYREAALFNPAKPKTIEESYRKVNQDPGYVKLTSNDQIKIIGTWDDHDYGENDGDFRFPYKVDSRHHLLDFLKVPKSDPRWDESHSGVYSVEYVEYGTDNNQTAAVILLDTRYNKDPWVVTEKEGDFLGELQWKWLEDTLTNSDRRADVYILVSSIQVLPEKRPLVETWDRFSSARRRLLNLFIKAKISAPIVLSGDVHFSEISEVTCLQTDGKRLKENQHPIDIWEFTSSGLTHATRRVPITGFILDVFIRWFFPTNHVNRRELDGEKQIFTGRNMGVLDISSSPDGRSKVAIYILNSSKDIVLSKVIHIGNNGKKEDVGSSISNDDDGEADDSSDDLQKNDTSFSRAKYSEKNHVLNNEGWECIPPEGHVSHKQVQLGIQLASITLAFYICLLATVVVGVLDVSAQFIKSRYCMKAGPKKLQRKVQ